MEHMSVWNQFEEGVMKIIYGLAIFLLFNFGTASAIPLRMDFSADGFVDIQSGGPRPVPLDPVSGSITYDAVGSDILSLIGIDLTIDGYSYSIGDIGFSKGVSGNFSFFHTDSGENVNSVNVNDFFLRVKYIVPSQLNLVPFGGSPYMMYSVESDRGLYDNFFNRTGTYTVSNASVPEPSVIALMSLGLFGLVLSRGKKKV